MKNNTKGYSAKDLTSNSSDGWDYKNDNEVETLIVTNNDEDFFASNDEDDDDMDCVFFN
jgi:hypothetical protein